MSNERSLQGVGAAGGVAIGQALVYRPEAASIARRTAGSPEQEKARFAAAIEAVGLDLDRLAAAADEQAHEILSAHKLMLGDPELQTLVETEIEAGKAAEGAVDSAIAQFAALLEGLDDPYLRERAADVRDVGRRLGNALTGKATGLQLTHPAVVVARDLAPTDTIGIDRSLLLGIVTEQGGPTSHTCILARSWGIPAVVAVPGLLAQVQGGGSLAVDGSTGTVVIDPAPATTAEYQQRLQAQHERAAAELSEAGLPAETPDGHRVELAGNAGSPDDVKLVMERGGEGIGLLRSEFLFMGRDTAPTEEEQYQAYAAALQNAKGGRVIIRTMDIGGDKDVPYLGLPKEENPFLGNRALRFCFTRPEFFRTQLRALLRAGVHGRLAIMFPMVAGLDDLRRAKAALEAARQSLIAEGLAHTDKPEVGIMIEIPSAALVASHLAQEVDFFSVGTNDLTQYTLAVDRGNPELADRYEPYNPAVLSLIDLVVQAADSHGKWVGVCGEAGGQPTGALLLLGLGVAELSMSAASLPKIRSLVRSVRFADAQALARAALAAGTAAEVQALVDAALSPVQP